MTVGMIHGRFQPFHRGHLAYLAQAATCCDRLIVGITNPDPTHAVAEASDPTRHLPAANPFSYLERVRMVAATRRELRIPPDALDVVPFPIHRPELWSCYTEPGTIQFIRLFSKWGATKIARLRTHGFEVVVLDEGAEKEVSGADVRAALSAGDPWEQMVPNGVAEVIRSSRTYASLTA